MTAKLSKHRFLSDDHCHNSRQEKSHVTAWKKGMTLKKDHQDARSHYLAAAAAISDLHGDTKDESSLGQMMAGRATVALHVIASAPSISFPKRLAELEQGGGVIGRFNTWAIHTPVGKAVAAAARVSVTAGPEGEILAKVDDHIRQAAGHMRELVRIAGGGGREAAEARLFCAELSSEAAKAVGLNPVENTQKVPTVHLNGGRANGGVNGSTVNGSPVGQVPGTHPLRESNGVRAATTAAQQ